MCRAPGVAHEDVVEGQVQSGRQCKRRAKGNRVQTKYQTVERDTQKGESSGDCGKVSADICGGTGGGGGW